MQLRRTRSGCFLLPSEEGGSATTALWGGEEGGGGEDVCEENGKKVRELGWEELLSYVAEPLRLAATEAAQRCILEQRDPSAFLLHGIDGALPEFSTGRRYALHFGGEAPCAIVERGEAGGE